MPEPSVLDYLKALLSFGRNRLPKIPAAPKRGQRSLQATTTQSPRRSTATTLRLVAIPWRSGLAVLLFLAAQFYWLPPHTGWQLGILIALAAGVLAVWAAQHGEWRLPQFQKAQIEKKTLTFRRTPLALGLLFFALTFLFSGGNQFTFLNVTCWVLSLGFVLAAFWQLDKTPQNAWQNIKARLQLPAWNLNLTRWTLVLLAAFAVIAFYRFSQLAAAPPEMTSDHAEKLLDVRDLMAGDHAIFFERNTGREPLQFYLTAAVADLFATGISFLSLKLGTVLLAFFSLIYIYLLGKEIGGRWVGLLALLFVGIAFWPNLLARTGLRFSLYPTFAAPALYHLIHGLRRGALNDFLLSGVFMGVGLNGYSPFRVVPLVAGAAVVLFHLHTPNREQRRRAWVGFLLLGLVALVLCAPLLRYSVEHPEQFTQRMFSRMLETERPYPNPVLPTLASNVLVGLTMFNYSGGNIWLVGLAERPAFDVISAAFLLLGIVLVALRYARHRSWVDLFLLVSIPLLMLPSTLSIAFPEENPAMNRASGAWIPAFLLCAVALDSFLHGWRAKLGDKVGLRVAQLSGALILLLIAGLNYSLFFNSYVKKFGENSWNSSEMGAVIAEYAGSFGTYESAWVLPYAHWVDTRLVGINAGNPGTDYAIPLEQLSNTLAVPAPKLFLLKPEDQGGLDTLRQLYPAGLLATHPSRVPGKEFLTYFVPANQ